MSKPSKIDKKTQNYVERLFTNNFFQGRIHKIRKINGIPRRGLNSVIYDNLIISEKDPRIADEIQNPEKYKASVNNLLREYGLSAMWFDLVSDYIQFKIFGDVTGGSQMPLLNLGPKSRYQETEMATFAKCVETNPLVLLIPPYASTREIIDFINVNRHRIKFIQKTYQSGRKFVGKTRSKNPRIKERDRFIYANKGLPKRDLMRVVREKFGDLLDYTYINKIIAEGRKKKSVGI